jgi:hypothetical protein
MSTTTKGQTGVTFHFVEDGMTVHTSTSLHNPGSYVARRGTTLLVTDEVRAACTDRLGRCLFDLTEDEQVRRFGRVMFRPGLPPEDFDAFTPESAEWDDARRAALADAWALHDEDEQRAALARVRERFGRPTTSTTLRTTT